MMRRQIISLAAAALLMAAGGMAATLGGTIYVGDCRHGELSRTSHEDPITGETTVIVCAVPSDAQG